MTDPTPNDISHLSDAEFQSLCPQGEHAPGPEPLSPAAQFVMDAYRKRYAETLRPGPFVDNWQEVCAAAALRAASDRTMDLIGDICHPKYIEGIEAASDFLDHIAIELEGHA